MGMMIGYRFKGIVKKELRDIFEPIALEGRWEESPDPFLRNFTYNSWKFPCSYDGHVRRWCKDTWQRSYNKETGEWIFEADMNINHSPCSKWEHFIIPYCMESVSHYEVWNEFHCDAWEEDEEYTCLKKYENGKFTKLGWFDINGAFLSEEQFVERIGSENYKWHILGELPEQA